MGEKHCITMVDDNPHDVLFVRQALKQAGLPCEVTHLEDGSAALLAFAVDGSIPPPDLILLDLNLPCVSGLEVLRAVRQNPRLAATPVAILTSSCVPADREESLRLGADRYLQKPVELKELRALVTRAVQELLHLDCDQRAPATTDG